MEISVTKKDGSTEPYDANKINLAIERAAAGMPNPEEIAMKLASELELTLFDGITTKQLDESVIQVALQNIKDDPIYDKIASRLLLKIIYREVLGVSQGDQEIKDAHASKFQVNLREAVTEGLLDSRLADLFDLEKLAEVLEPSRDELLKYIAVVTMYNRYGLKDRAGNNLETPQTFWMRVAMGLSLNEADPTSQAIIFYEKMSKLEYLAAGSTLVNAGAIGSNLSNCFILEMQDDIEGIAKTMRDVMWLTKGTGGIGLSMTKLRAQGSPIRSNNTVSTGPIPFIHTIDSILRAISRGGKKFGALCVYMENWHLDFPEFLDLRQNSGDPYRRTRTANTAVWISDEFMKRVQNNEDWYLFDPLEVPDLNDIFGKEFSERYNYYVGQAEAGKMHLFKKVSAKKQFKDMLISLSASSHPWLTWKDTINNRALNTNTGIIHSSNLCTEIALPQDENNVAVCNLASINLTTHLLPNHTVDYKKLEESTKIAIRHLDNLVDITRSAVPEADHSNEQNRAIGLGVMGFTDMTEKLGYAYDSEESFQLIDEIMEHISYYAIEASVALARERGAYPQFDGSGWSKGMVPFDTIDRMEQDRVTPVQVNRNSTLDWDSLRKQVRGGMRNATLMAIAPTASIGLIAGTTPGFDPQFTQIFSRSTGSGKFLEVNQNLVKALKDAGIWDDVKMDILRSQGDIQPIALIPDEIKKVYKTSFQVDPYAFLEIAARAQKWIDQAISRNMYLETRDIDELAEIYMGAWERGVKTTYYLHQKPRHQAEQSTVKVNKREAGPITAQDLGSKAVSAQPIADGAITSQKIARRGFGGLGVK